MKFSLACLLVLVAAASTAPQFPFLPAIGSPFLPVQPWAQGELGRFFPGGLVYPGLENFQIGSWPWGPMGLTPFYPTDPRFLIIPGTVNPVTPNEIKPIVPVTRPVTGDDTSKLKPVNEVKPVAPVPIPASKESKPKELLSSTPTVAERSRCLQNYRRPVYEMPEGALYMVGSDIAYPNQFPFLAALVEFDDDVEDYILACGASLISPTKILTAAHCVTYEKSTRVIPARRFQVKLGMHFLNISTNDAQLSKNVINIKIHEEYYTDDYTTLNDVAILTMDSPVQYTDTISPVCLVPDCIDDENEQEVTAMGWGNTKSGGKNSDFLRTASLSTVPNSKCRETYENLVDDQMLCAYKEGKDTCQNDSGGPLVIDANVGRQSGFETTCRYMQVGVVSFGEGCAKKGKPGVYARVKNYLPWILEHSE